MTTNHETIYSPYRLRERMTCWRLLKASLAVLWSGLSLSNLLRSRVACTEIQAVWNSAEVAVGNPARTSAVLGLLWWWGRQVAFCCLLGGLEVMREFLGSTWPLVKSPAHLCHGSAWDWGADGMWKLMSHHSQAPSRVAWRRLLHNCLLTYPVTQLWALL